MHAATLAEPSAYATELAALVNRYRREASVAGLDAPTEPAPEPEPASHPVSAPEPTHASPHSGSGTEPDGGTEIT